MGRQMVEQERAKGHLRVVRFTAKVILGPLLALVLWTLVYNFTPAPQSGTVRKNRLVTARQGGARGRAGAPRNTESNGHWHPSAVGRPGHRHTPSVTVIGAHCVAKTRLVTARQGGERGPGLSAPIHTECNGHWH